jgi:hypothetical protein
MTVYVFMAQRKAPASGHGPKRAPHLGRSKTPAKLKLVPRLCIPGRMHEILEKRRLEVDRGERNVPSVQMLRDEHGSCEPAGQRIELPSFGSLCTLKLAVAAMHHIQLGL